MNKDKWRHIVRISKAIAAVTMVLCALSICWVGAYYAMEWMYTRMNWYPHTLTNHLLNSIAGFILFGMIMSVVSLVIQKKQGQFFYQLIDALKRISRGDYKVEIPTHRGDMEHWMGKLVGGINEMAVNLKAMEEMRQEFVANVSHEIQSPLTSISGFARAMRESELPRGEQVQYLEIIETESARLSRLSDDLLRLATLDSEQYELQKVQLRLDQQLRQQILLFEPQWLAKSLTMEADLAEDIQVVGDPNLLGQVWVNLLHNAIKFTPEGGSVNVTMKRVEEGITFSITDSGIGMTEEEQERIFERFYKADLSRIRTTGGSGLGLAIVQKIVDLHGGEIHVSSAPGKGSIFTVKFPK